MGLGAPKKRTKLSHDPNNTTWAKSTTNYGHKILSKQGWSPGSYLGAENAAHAEHYSAANASHIRVLLREDNLGLGAKVGGNGRAETFGLATLSGIFGRLNGKSDEAVEKQQSALRDAELRSWHAGKHGFMNFVRGGYLVGDKVQETLDNKPQSTLQSSIPKKKRKAAEMEDVPDHSTKKAKSERKAKSEPQSELEESDDAVVKEQTKKKKKKSKHSEDDHSGTGKQQVSNETDERAVRKVEKKARKEERRKRKEEKRLRKAAKEAKKVAAIIPTPDPDHTSSSSESDSTPAQSTGVSTPQFAGSRHAVRQRYIQQKRMASMNPQALKEILMLKAQG